MKQMEQLIFITLSLTRGGAERVICNMCNEYFAKRYRVTIISLMRVEPEYRLDERIRLIYADETKEQARQNLAVRFLRRRKALGRIFGQIGKEEGKLCAFVSFLPEPNMISCSLKHAIKSRLIISVRNAPAVEYRGKVRYLLMRLLYPKADAYVFQTNQAKNYFSFSGHIIRNSAVIFNPIGHEFIGHAVSVNRKKEIVWVGRLEEQKDPMCLLKAFAAVHEQFPEYRLMLYGEGSLRDQLFDEISCLGLCETVFLKGNVEQVEAAIWDASLFVMSSRYEGMPNALMEAMALGVPVISTDCPCGGPAGLIRNGENGLLVPAENWQELAEAMAKMLSDPDEAQKMGIRAQDIVEDLKPDVIYEQWESVIRAE